MNYIGTRNKRFNIFLLAILNNAIECGDEKFLETEMCRLIVQALGLNYKPVITQDILELKYKFLTNSNKELVQILGISYGRISEMRHLYGWRKKDN